MLNFLIKFLNNSKYETFSFRSLNRKFTGPAIQNNKIEQAQNYTFLDDFSKQLEKIVEFRLLQGASSIYYP
jgi:hypothetical protein